MNQKEITEALQQIANNKGCTPEEARRGIQLAIDAARENPDPNVRAVW
ncbi:MAG TPA: sporulation initiation factor Spo0A, partial [Clostridiales bacterium]|nr:sporulation initiation factor Spo0A [Clostridiales bacterium]